MKKPRENPTFCDNEMNIMKQILNEFYSTYKTSDYKTVTALIKWFNLKLNQWMVFMLKDSVSNILSMHLFFGYYFAIKNFISILFEFDILFNILFP